jgi:hypothetical protein
MKLNVDSRRIARHTKLRLPEHARAGGLLNAASIQIAIVGFRDGARRS